MAKKRVKNNDKIVFSYDKDTREYTSEYICQPDPMKVGSFLIPANATEIPPPETHLFERACFIDNAWIILPDYRKRKVVILATQFIIEIRELGELPDDSVLLTIDDEYKLNNGYLANVDEDGNLEFFLPPPTIAQQIITLEIELANTDWYVVRYYETGEPIPETITIRRAQLRELISDLRTQGV